VAAARKWRERDTPEKERTLGGGEKLTKHLAKPPATWDKLFAGVMIYPLSHQRLHAFFSVAREAKNCEPDFIFKQIVQTTKRCSLTIIFGSNPHANFGDGKINKMRSLFNPDPI
jgi:hypothetical protein